MAKNLQVSDLEPVKNFIRPDKLHGCTYEKAISHLDEISSPHNHVKSKSRDSNQICNSILDMVGNTPLVHLKNISNDYGIKCNLYAKCEYLNAGGSVKDRIGLRMIEEAEKAGYLKPNNTIIEPTSGNTGIGLALACAVKGYKCIIVMPEKMSKEKNDVLKALGAQIIRTPTSAAFDAPDSHISEAQRIKERLNAENPNTAWILDQYTNPYNPIAHYDSTAEEIISQMNGKQLDLFVATAGTGGTICGLARKLKERYPKCTIIGVDPKGSILAEPNSLNLNQGSGFYEVEGIGYDFIPTVLDRKRVDLWYKSIDSDSFRCSRELIKREGLLCGGSSGSVTYCALNAIKEKGFNLEGLNVVTLLPDSVRNYMTKFLSDEWMITRGFFTIPEVNTDPYWFHKRITDIGNLLKPADYNLIESNKTIYDALALMREKNVDCLLAFDSGILKHVITKKNIMSKLVNNLVTTNSPVNKVALDKFRILEETDELRKLQCCLDAEGYAIVFKKDFIMDIDHLKQEGLLTVINTDILLQYIAESQ